MLSWLDCPLKSCIEGANKLTFSRGIYSDEEDATTESCSRYDFLCMSFVIF